MDFRKTAERLIDTCNASTCSFTSARYAMKRLSEAGFERLDLTGDFNVQFGGRYYVNVFDSSVIAFTIGKKFADNNNIRIAASHTDHPCLAIKPNPEMLVKEYGRINVEVYGGPILNTWLDRPLSVAGRVSLKSDNVFAPEKKIVDFDRPVFTIPNLAIHMNRKINEGIELNRQTDMIPLATVIEDELNKNDFFMEYLAKELSVAKDDILDFELYVYNYDKGQFVGLNEEFISCPRLDNTTSVESCVQGIINAGREEGFNIAAMFDNEEVGNRTKQGAASSVLTIIMERVYAKLGFDRDRYLRDLTDGFLLSIDVAHACHPNRSEKADPTNVNILNQGVIIKRAASQTYATDCESVGIIEQLCHKYDVKYQKFANRSDGTTGSTLGSPASTLMAMKAVDIGIPMLAMHSAREMMGVKDQVYLEQLVNAFFTE